MKSGFLEGVHAKECTDPLKEQEGYHGLQNKNKRNFIGLGKDSCARQQLHQYSHRHRASVESALIQGRNIELSRNTHLRTKAEILGSPASKKHLRAISP